jgi:hypothetical protein
MHYPLAVNPPESLPRLGVARRLGPPPSRIQTLLLGIQIRAKLLWSGVLFLEAEDLFEFFVEDGDVGFRSHQTRLIHFDHYFDLAAGGHVTLELSRGDHQRADEPIPIGASEVVPLHHWNPDHFTRLTAPGVKGGAQNGSLASRERSAFVDEEPHVVIRQRDPHGVSQWRVRDHQAYLVSKPIRERLPQSAGEIAKLDEKHILTPLVRPQRSHEGAVG